MDSKDAGIKYFSGTATYSQTLNADAAWFKPVRVHLILDLGELRELAGVKINGKDLGIVWNSRLTGLMSLKALKAGAPTRSRSASQICG